MTLPIYLYGHPVLRKPTESITAEYPELQKLISDMWETMYHSEGVGLAAPQIGRSIRLIVIDGSPLAESEPSCADGKMVLINPELTVIDDIEPISRDEGCLSLPGLSESVKRTEHIRLRWFDENFQPHEKEFNGFLSRIIQHEYDHLEGKVYMDHVSPIRRTLLKSKLAALVKGRVKCDYKVVPAPKSPGMRK